jgi:hypothetical protein
VITSAAATVLVAAAVLTGVAFPSGIGVMISGPTAALSSCTRAALFTPVAVAVAVAVAAWPMGMGVMSTGAAGSIPAAAAEDDMQLQAELIRDTG